MWAADSSGMLLVPNYQATRRHVAADGNIFTAMKTPKSLIQYGYVTRLLLPITSILKKKSPNRAL
jgi:hypothetical protein